LLSKGSLVRKDPESEGLDISVWPLKRCAACGSWQVNPHPGPEASRRFFRSPDRWLSGLDPDKKIISPVERAERRKEEYAVYAAAMAAMMPESGAILDVGAGTGLMLSLINAPNRKIAVEPNEMAAQRAADRGLAVLREWAEDLPAPDKPLAALIMNQTLDHLPRPDIFLFKAMTWLSPGGLLLLGGLINPSSLAARIYGLDFRLLHPFHQVYPTPFAVKMVLASMGFELLSTWRPYFGTPYGSIPQFLQASAAMALKLLRVRSGGPSPAYPGNTVTYLARKIVLYKPLKVPEAAQGSIAC
jgi:SAM-dependent methyltransferase